MQLLDLFKMKEPSGRHLCLVEEALGREIESDRLSPENAWGIVR